MRATAHIHALYANSLAVIGHGRGWIIMDSTRIYQTASGWVYAVWFQGRVIVIGCRATLEAATRAAAGL